jgi:EAL domain-containing protein (putative c-di-GMP-specific phosphodiesterase class I)
MLRAPGRRERSIKLATRLASLGVSIAVDDVDMGYSNMTCVRRLRIAML